jgi:hypothetical protein
MDDTIAFWSGETVVILLFIMWFHKARFALSRRRKSAPNSKPWTIMKMKMNLTTKLVCAETKPDAVATWIVPLSDRLTKF